MEEFEQLNIFDMTLPKFRIDKPIRLIELFAGIGSQAMALRDLGADFEHYRVVEFDKFAIASYNAIHGTDFPTMDITQISGLDLGITETDKYCYIMTYSFPCQDLSTAGKQRGMRKDSGTRSGLLWEVERLLNEVESLPQVLVMENVPQVHSDENINDFYKWIDFLSKKGYSNYWKDLNAKDYGIAQNRERCFMVSILGEWNYKFPRPIELNKTMKESIERKADKKYYIHTENAQKLIEKIKECAFEENIPLVDSGIKVVGSLNPQKECQDRVRVLSIYGNCQCLRATDYKDPPKIAIKDEMGCLKIRRITPLEHWRIMGFSDKDFDKAKNLNSNLQLYKQSGNSIVKDVLMGIFKQLIA